MHHPDSPPEKRVFVYGWILLLICLSNIMISSGVAHSFSVIFVALLADFGMSRAEISGIFSLFIFVFFSGGILVGPLLDRTGPRIVIPMGSALVGLGLFACSRISSPYQLYLFYGLITSLGACCTAWLPNSIVISNWFVRRRGMAVGLMMCGNGLAILVFIPLTQMIVDWTGWRNSFLMIAAIAVLWMGPVNAAFQRAEPSDKGYAPDGDVPRGSPVTDGEIPPAPSSHGFFTLHDALRRRSFWMMCVAMFCNPFATFTVVLHQLACVVEQGFEPMVAAPALGFIGIFAMAGRFLGGSLSDNIGREPAYSIFMGCFGIAVLLLLVLTPENAWILPFYVVLMGLGMGVGGAMFPPIMADLFPGPSLGRIMGVTSIFGGIGAGFGSWFAGYFHDLTGSYTFALLFVVMTIVGAVLSVWAAAPRKSG
jgi:MFS family permease